MRVERVAQAVAQKLKGSTVSITITPAACAKTGTRSRWL